MYRPLVRPATPQDRRARRPPREGLLVAVLARLVPLDGDGGGADPDVASAVAERLSLPGFAAVRRDVTACLELLDSRARERFAQGFGALRPEDRDDLLRELQDQGSPASRRFFQVLLTLTLEASLSGPYRGAPREARGWRHVGLEPAGPAGDAGRSTDDVCRGA